MQPNIFGNDDNWHYIPVLICVLTIITYLFGLWLPESPKYLYFKNRPKADVIKVIKTYQGNDIDINHVLEGYEKERQFTNHHNLTLKEVWQNQILRKSLIMLILVQFASKASISSILEYYETSLLISFGFTQSSVLYLMNIATILNLPLMFLSPFLLEKVGRRPLILIASFGYIILPIIGFV
uniref:Major facilitator superfamily (MFS) profile domain-containing protein n=1 Tax=Acrobeloides nanus TaxID=290746 RepID=A0A914D6E6_9BILA